MEFIIAPMAPEDWAQVRAIYLEGIATGNATFETGAPSQEEWFAKHIAECSLVACGGDCILGWAALSPVSSRCVYSGVAEVSVYVGEGCRGQGLGRALLEALIETSEKQGIWTLQAGIFPENAPSLAIHYRCGFREVGRREKLGKAESGAWRDVLLLERRSPTIGID